MASYTQYPQASTRTLHKSCFCSPPLPRNTYRMYTKPFQRRDNQNEYARYPLITGVGGTTAHKAASSRTTAFHASVDPLKASLDRCLYATSLLFVCKLNDTLLLATDSGIATDRGIAPTAPGVARASGIFISPAVLAEKLLFAPSELVKLRIHQVQFAMARSMQRPYGAEGAWCEAAAS